MARVNGPCYLSHACRLPTVCNSVITYRSYFHLPAFALLFCGYHVQGLPPFTATRKALGLVFVVSVIFVLISMPMLLPLFDGVFISNTFAKETLTIRIPRDVYKNYTNGLWPFILLALLFSNSRLRRLAWAFAALASLNAIIVVFHKIGFESFFDLWKQTPVLRNVRWLYPFLEMSSVASAFCCGIYLDACRDRNTFTAARYRRIGMVLGSLLMLYLSTTKFPFDHRGLGLFTAISVVFALMFMAQRRHIVAAVGTVTIAVMMMFSNWIYSSPSHWKDGEFHGASKSRDFRRAKTDKYVWWMGSGYDPYSPGYRFGPFSMVFPGEYRNLLSLLYEMPVEVQRPHWVFKEMKRAGIKPKPRPVIAELMDIERPWQRESEVKAFVVYDDWIVAGTERALELMRAAEFSADGPVILESGPALDPQRGTKLDYRSQLTGKTAETLELRVSTNKNSIVVVPEIYHRDWRARVDGQPAPVLKAYASVRAVALTPGDHDIELRFVYQPFRLGVAICATTLAALIVTLVVMRRREQRRAARGRRLNRTANRSQPMVALRTAGWTPTPLSRR